MLPRPHRVLGLLLSLFVSCYAFAADPPPVRSILAPLAQNSLLLDAARAGGRIVVVGDRGIVLLSDDDGAQWRQVQVPTRVMLTAVKFFDDKLGFAVGHDAVVLRTVDGGDNWSLVHYAPREERPLFDVLIAGPKYAVAVGAYGYYLESIDGGTNWSKRELHSTQNGASADPAAGAGNQEPPDDFHLNAIVAAGPQRWYMAAEAGTVYRTDNSGQTWTRLPSPYEGSFFGILPIATDTLLLYGLQGRVYRSEDGGKKWQRVDTGTHAILMNGLRLNDGRTILVGLSGAVLVGDKQGRQLRLYQQTDRRGIAAAITRTNGGLLLIGEGGIRELPQNELAEGS